MTISCKRCLVYENDPALYNSIHDYISNLPPEIRADQTLYEDRLFVCGNCEHLINGLCSLCGCFAEVRAAKKALHCAKSDQVW